MDEKAMKNKELVRYFLDEVYNKGNMDVADQLVASDYLSHNKLGVQVLGPDGIKTTATMQRNAFPDLYSEVIDIIAEGDKVVVRGKDTGTFKNAYYGVQPTGNKFTLTWIDIFRLENGKLQEAWLEMDIEDMKQQLTGSKQP